MPPKTAQDEAKSGRAQSATALTCRPWAARPGLTTFWAGILLTTAAGAAYLQYLGPPNALKTAAATPPSSVPKPAPSPIETNLIVPATDRETAAQSTFDDQAINQTTTPPPAGASIPLPSTNLLAASAINPQWQIPKIATDGATPMQTYAASPLPPPDAALLPSNVPRIAVIVTGLGDDQTLMDSAVALPPEISLALSPYGKNTEFAATEARGAGHETLLELPMPGLLAAAPLKQNQATLDWSMSVFEGFAGVTDAFGPAMGGGFMNNATAKNWLMTNIARHGLFYIEGDPTANLTPYTAGRNADIVIDPSDGQEDETVKLAALITDAESQHTALAIMLSPTPGSLQTLANWSATLLNDDILLVPVSALVQPPDIPLALNASNKQ